jgi:hypothetical protein
LQIQGNPSLTTRHLAPKVSLQMADIVKKSHLTAKCLQANFIQIKMKKNFSKELRK